MQTQNFKNHRQIVYGYYAIAGIPILILLVLATRYVIKVGIGDHYQPLMFLLTGWIFLALLFRSRGFALKAQDRAIRAEESLRYFMLTGKQLDHRLSIHQIVALRFASDEELPGLVQKTIEENLGNKDIKRLIKNWRADRYRV